MKLSNGKDFSITEEILKSWMDIKDDFVEYYNETEEHLFMKTPIKDEPE